jgi:hypothetical protein
MNVNCCWKSHPSALGGGDLLAPEDQGEVQHRRANGRVGHGHGQVLGVHGAGHEQHGDDHGDAGEDQAVAGALGGGEGVRNPVCFLGQLLAAQGVDDQTYGHADGGGAKAPVETLAFLQPAGDQRADQRTGVDAHVEDGEPGVAAFVLLAVQAADEGGGVRLQAAGADAHQHQPGDQAGYAGHECQPDVARHDQDGRAEQHALRPEEPVREPGAEDGGEVDAATVGADEAGRHGLWNLKATLGGREVHVVEEDPLHSVEGEALPHLYGEKAGQHLWVAKKRGVARRLSGRTERGIARRCSGGMG